MSRIGRLPIPVPTGVDVTIDGSNVTVKGPKGSLSHVVVEPITVAKDGAAAPARRQPRPGGTQSGLSGGLCGDRGHDATGGDHVVDGDVLGGRVLIDHPRG